MAHLLDVDDCSLVVIDVQPSFLDKVEPALASQVVDRIAWLAGLALRLEIPLVVTEEEPEINRPTHASIVAALPPDHLRHRKPTFGVGGSAQILDAIRAHGRSTAVLVGLETDVCVAQSALTLLDAGFRVAVVADAVASPGTSHEQGLARMRDAGVVVIGTKGLAYEWIRDVERLHLLPGRAPEGIVL
jgi:nicotinamidase-related amidase